MDDDRLALLELVRCLARLFEAEVSAPGPGGRLRPVHLRALGYLRQANRYSNTPAALAEYLGSTKGTVSQSLLLLYRRGLVERLADPDDGRVVRLALSRSGRQLLHRLGVAGDWSAALEGLDPGAVAGARKVLAQGLRRLQQQASNRSFGVCRSCAKFREERGGFRCGLTGEALSAEDAQRICREHEWPAQG